MLAKLVIIVVALALTAASLLAVRQQRLQAVGEMATAIERAAALERRTWRARVEIARLASPRALEEALRGLGEFEPICVRWCEIVDVAAPCERRVAPRPGHGG